MYDFSIANGVAQGDSGGGIYNNGDLGLHNVSLYNNQADLTTGGGGAVANALGATLNVEGCHLSHNQAKSGGAIYNNGQAYVGLDTLVEDNNASQGGGIYNFTSGQLTIDNSQIYANWVTDSGGGIFNYYGQLTMQDHATVENNNAANNGGGLWTNGTATLTEVMFTYNTASNKGGGFYVRAGTTTLTYCYVAGNTCGVPFGGNGGAWVLGATLTITNSQINDSVLQDQNP